MNQQSMQMRWLVTVGVLCFLAVRSNAASTPEKSIKIFRQPQSQLVEMGESVTFSVAAEEDRSKDLKELQNLDGLTKISYQWEFNGILLDGTNNWVRLAIPGATSSSITITDVQTNNVGYYRVLVGGRSRVSSAPAALQAFIRVFTPEDPDDDIIVNGTPIASSGGGSYCPGSHVGYVPYTNNPPAGKWGWAPVNTSLSIKATDGVPTANSQVAYLGFYGDVGCAYQSVSKSPPFAYPSGSPRYMFTIYFTGSVPTNKPYPLRLTNLQ